MKCKHALDTMSFLTIYIYWLTEIQHPHYKMHNLSRHKERNELWRSHKKNHFSCPNLA